MQVKKAKEKREDDEGEEGEEVEPPPTIPPSAFLVQFDSYYTKKGLRD
jgi:hypothetical protein